MLLMFGWTLTQVAAAPFIGFRFGLWIPLLPQEPLLMLSTPQLFTAAVRALHLVLDLGLTRLPSARLQVEGIQDTGVGIRLVGM